MDDEQLAMRKEDWKKLKIRKTEFYAYYWVKFASIYIILNFELSVSKTLPARPLLLRSFTLEQSVNWNEITKAIPLELVNLVLTIRVHFAAINPAEWC